MREPGEDDEHEQEDERKPAAAHLEAAAAADGGWGSILGAAVAHLPRIAALDAAVWDAAAAALGLQWHFRRGRLGGIFDVSTPSG